MSMRIIYKLETEDIIYFNIQHIKQLPKSRNVQKRNRIIVYLVYIIAGVILIAYYPQYWIFPLFIFILGSLWYRFYSKAWEQRKVRQLKKLFKQHEDPRVGQFFELVLKKTTSSKRMLRIVAPFVGLKLLV